MVRSKIKYLVIVSVLFCLSCKKNSGNSNLNASGYPSDVGTIILGKCATSGCHNNLSYSNAGGLNLNTWDDMFNGYVVGAAVIPYRSDFSSLCYFSNTYTDLGIALQPTMPVNNSPLTRTEYLTISNWINAGAPNAGGYVKFSGNTSRGKFYITNQLCNVVTVVDADSLLQMRYINVGEQPSVQFPYCVKVSPDKKYWYVSFFTQSNIIQKFSADQDKLIAEINIGLGSWTSFAITSDSKYGYFVDNSAVGKIAYVDLDNMIVLATYTFNGNFQYPVGIAINEGLKKMYVGSVSGNFIYSIDISNPLSPSIYEMPIDGSATVQYQSLFDPIELLADPDFDKCYIACNLSHEIRVFDMQHDTLTSVIPLGTAPAYLSYSQLVKKLFVTCPDDSSSFLGNRGSVAVIDVQNNTVYTKINSGYQPYGIAVDDQEKIVAVVNSNISSGGPASHHVSGCGKKNGNMTFIDLNTLNLLPNKNLELAVYPFAIGSR